jgi:hypothetical protein
MTEEKIQQLWESYQAAWADISPEQREELLHSSVIENIVFTSPNSDGQGIDLLAEHIAQFQVQYPGAYFQSNRLTNHHGQLLSEWTMFNRDGSEFLTGHSYAQFNNQGRLMHLAGFWTL